MKPSRQTGVSFPLYCSWILFANFTLVLVLRQHLGVLGCLTSPCPVRDVLARTDLKPLTEPQSLSAEVASHGVQAFLLG